MSTADDEVLRVRGDRDHPISSGYTCEKGRALPQWHHSPMRLDRPSMRGRVVSWEELITDLSTLLTGVIDSTGPDGIGVYLATGLAYDSVGQVATALWLAAMGSSSFYTAVTVDNAPVLVAAEQVAGHPMLNPVWDPSVSQLVLLVGTNPIVSHGYGTTLADPVRRFREHQSRGGRIWTIDPRRTESAALSDEHLATRPGSDVILLAALVRALLDDERCRAALDESCRADEVERLIDAVEPFTIEHAVVATGCDRNSIERLIVDLRSAHGHLAVFCGTGITMSVDGVVAEWLRWVLLIMTDSLDVVGGMRFNRGVVNRLSGPTAAGPSLPGPASRPDLARVVGQLPVAGLVDEIEAGRLRVLVVTGGNPLSAFPDPERFRNAIALLDAFVVIDVMDSELTQLASHVLPASGQLERADLTLAEQVAFRSGMQFTSAVVPAVGDRRPVWWMLARLAESCGRPIFEGAPVEFLSDETIIRGLLGHGPLDADAVIDAGPHGVTSAPEYGWVRPLMTLDGCWSVAPEPFVSRLAQHRGPELGLVLIPRRESAWSNSVLFAGDGGDPVVRMHPDDAATRQIQDGDWVAVSSEHGSLVATVGHDPSVRPGSLSVTHGHPGAFTGTLTSSSEGVDPLTAMPRTSGLPVTIAKLGT